ISLEGHVIVMLSRIMLSLMSYNGFVQAYAVTAGWTIVRDVANMFFILVLLALSIGTILKIESYNFKRLLPKVLLMAVLVNFSRTICGLMIDFAQVVMMTFAVSFASVAGAADLMATLHITDMINYSGKNISGAKVADGSMVVTGMLAVVLLLIAMLVILVMTVVILMRMIMLWILLVLSPLPFILSAFPAGQRYAQQWWTEFTKYVIVGPVMAFFLWLSFAVASKGFSDETLGGTSASAQKLIASSESTEQDVPAGGQSTQGIFSGIGDTKNFLSFVIGIGMLMGGLMVTQQLGVAGGSFAGSMLNRIKQTGLGGAQKALSLGLKAPLKTYGWAARKIAAGKLPGGAGLAGLQLNPVIIYQGIKKSLDERKNKEIIQGQVASGKALEAGGMGGLVKGLGAGQDWGDAYIKGFLNLKGFGRMGRTLTGDEETIRGFRGEEESEKKQAALDYQKYVNRRAALGLTDTEREAVLLRDMSYETDEKKSPEFKLAIDDARRRREVGEYDNKEHDQELFKVLNKAGLSGVSTVGMSEEDIESLDEEKEIEINKFNEEWDKKVAIENFRKQGKIMTTEEAERKIASAAAGDQDALDEIDKLTNNYFADQSTKKSAEASRIEAGGFSDDELAANQKHLLSVNERMAFLLKRIANEKAAGRETAGLEEEKKALVEANEKVGTFDAARGLFTANTTMAKPTDDKKRADFEKSRQAKAETARTQAEKNQLLSQASSWSQAQRQTVLDESNGSLRVSQQHTANAQKASQKAEKYIPPRAFYASIAERSLVNDEQKKITSELDSELIANLRDSIQEGDNAKMAALVKKLTADGNDNEIWNAFGFTSDHKGMHSFFDAVVMGKSGVKKGDGTAYTGPALRMNEQQALALESDVSFINEKINHWETARVIDVKDGKYERMTEQDHATAALAEIMKKNPREISRSFNRLAYGGERPNPDGSRNFEASALGVALLRSLGQEIAENIGKTGAEYNKNAVMNIGQLSNKDLAGLRVPTKYVDAMRVKYDVLAKEAGIGVGAIVAKIFDEGIAEVLDRRNQPKT
ncbi:MAG: hypothetical protein WCX71_03520, partial [Candidatus Buchananbacteria bacterium]